MNMELIDSSHESNQDLTKKWFLFTLLYLFIDYARPQDILPIGIIKPGMITILILVGFIIFKGNLQFFYIKQVRMIIYLIILLAAYIPFASNNFYAYTTTRNVLLYTPFLISVTMTIISIERLKKMIHFMVLIMIYISIYSVIFKGKGSGSYFTDENDLSLYINMWVPFCYFLLIYEKSFKKKFIYIIGLGIGLTAIIVSFSRGGFVGLVAMAFIAWLFSSKKLISLIIILILSISIYYFSSTSYKTEMGTITNLQEGTAQARFESWGAAWRMFLDNPLGVGGNNFQVRFEEYQTDWFKRSMWGRVSHSLWFTLISELGIIGLILYIRLLYYNIRDVFFFKRLKMNTDEDSRYLYFLSFAFMSSLAGFFASGTFLSVLYYPHYFYITGLLIAAVNLIKNGLVIIEE